MAGTVELTASEVSEVGKILAGLEALNLRDISLDVKLYDSNGDRIGEVTNDYGDYRLEIASHSDD